MHWAAKLFSVVFLLHTGVLLAQAYQLKHLRVPAFNELHRAEGKLVLIKKDRDWLTGVEHPDGSQEFFTCATPGAGTRNLCFMDVEINKYKLNLKPEVIIWWYPMTTPLEDRIYRRIFQFQLSADDKPLGYGTRNERSYAKASFHFLRTHGIRMNIGMALLYALGVVFLFVWESYKYTRTKTNGDSISMLP